MNLTSRWRAALAIIAALSVVLTITVSTAPDSAAQADEDIAALEFRFDIVRENGSVCPADFESATPGPGEPLLIDEFEEVTFCFFLRNSGDTTITNVTAEGIDVGIALDLLPDLGPGEELVIPRDGFVPPGLSELLAFATATAGETLLFAEDTAAVETLPPTLPPLELRFDIVRENGSVCPADFESATEGPGEPLLIDEGEEVTYCFSVINNSEVTIRDVTVGSNDLGITPSLLPDLGPGEEVILSRDGFVPPGLFEILAFATATAVDTPLVAEDTALVEILPPLLPALELRFDIVRENGEVCPADFESATPGFGEPLLIDDGEEVTFCFALINNGTVTLTDVIVESVDVGIGLTPLPDIAPGQELILARDGFVPSGVTADITAFANATADATRLSAQDTALIQIVPPLLSALELRLDIVRENFESCPADFESATPGPGEPLFIDEFEEVTFCISILNAGETTITGLSAGVDDLGIVPFTLADLGPGEEVMLATDGFIEDFGLVEIQASATGIAADTLLQATDTALVDIIFLPMPVALIIDNYQVTDADEIIDVVVTLDPGFEVPITALQFSVLYDPSVITPVLSDDPNTAPVGAPACTGRGGCGPINPDGRVNVAAFIGAVTGDLFDVVSIPFRVVGDGESALVLVDALVIDEDGVIVEDVIVFDGNVVVQLPTPGPTCAGLPVTIDMRTGVSGIGTSSDDVIMGTSGADTIRGRGGNDVICALGGDDDIKGGSGDDLAYGGAGDDTIKGGSGNDELRGGAGNDEIRGNSGFDKVYGGTDDDRLWGDSDDDDLRGGPGNDEMRGGSGEDDLRGGAGIDLIWGGRDSDRLYGNLGNDVLRGGTGDDSHFGGGNVDTCIDRSGTNTFTGCEADHFIAGPR